MKLVSVIIPYFKKKNYIENTLNSILNQTYKNFEVIIIYDDEDKKELLFLKKIIKNKKKIRIIINKKNLGPGPSRNKGIRYAKGDFVAFIDADDIWKKNKLKYQTKFMLNRNALISHTSYEILKDTKIISSRKAEDFTYLGKLLKSCDIGLSTVMVRKKVFINYKLRFPDLKTKEDFVLWINFLKKSLKIHGISKKLTKWRKLENSLSSSIFQKLKDAFLVYNKYMKFNFFLSILYVLILSFNFVKKNFIK
tara:strand:+ start:153 stop:905 length:753 start_codon:yes stop_codon:yes gene_type:complete